MSRHPGLAHAPRLGLVVLALLVAALALAAWIWLPVITLALSGRASAAAAEEAASTERFAANLDVYTGRFDGRYLFFDPPPPRPEPRPIVREDPDDRPPPPPASYGGPRIVAIFADEVWFADGRRLRVGGEEDGSLRVISLDSPWGAEVEWRGVLFTVPFFQRHALARAAFPAATTEAPAALPPATGDDPEPAAPTADTPPSEPSEGTPAGDSDGAARMQAVTADPPSYTATTETQQQ